MKRRLKALVIGGGPGGLCCSLRLAASGVQVELADAAGQSARRIGETVGSGIGQLMQTLGLAESFGGLEPRPMRVLSAAWGSADFKLQDELFQVNGPAFHLDRARFDEWLRKHALEAGVRYLPNTRVRQLQRSAGGWKVQWGNAHEVRSFDVVVHAGGRQSSLSRRLDGGRAVRWDRLVGIARHVSRLERPVWRMTVEAIDQGWLYFTPYANDAGVLVFMTDSDLVAKRASRASNFEQAAGKTQHLCELLNTGTWTEPLVFDARSSISLRPVGAGYVMVGDAACSHDPLSSQGIERALQGGLDAADAIIAAYRGDTSLLAAYARQLHSHFDEYLAERRGYYELEQRFQREPFWSRRMRAVGPLGVSFAQEDSRRRFISRASNE